MLTIFIRNLCLWPCEFIVCTSIVIKVPRMLYPVKLCYKWICDIDWDHLYCAMFFFSKFDFYIHITTFFYFQLLTFYRGCEIPINEEDAKTPCEEKKQNKKNKQKKNKLITFKFNKNHKDKNGSLITFFSNVCSAMKKNDWPMMSENCVDRAHNLNSIWLLCFI